MSILWEKLVRPIMFKFDAERAHEIGIKALSMGFGGTVRAESWSDEAAIHRFGLRFLNPIGVAAGFDKNGVVIDALAGLGFGFVEIGTITYKGQPGNSKPRLFRLAADEALINRLGFNNDGAPAIAQRINTSRRNCIIGVNIGRNRDIPNREAVQNYLAAFEIVHPVADYLAINVSSPNTEGLRELQQASQLDELLSAISARNSQLGRKPFMLKIAPDLNEKELSDIVDVALKNKVSGIIATNTTTSREGIVSANANEVGGLSGRPLAARSDLVISHIYRYSNGRLPIIGVGGIFSAEDAFRKIEAGASLLQSYTGFVYKGRSFAADISKGLQYILGARGFKHLDEAVGSAAARTDV